MIFYASGKKGKRLESNHHFFINLSLYTSKQKPGILHKTKQKTLSLAPKVSAKQNRYT